LFNDSDVTLDGTPTERVTIGSRTYSPRAVGTLTGTTEFEDVAPYVGIGFGNAVSVQAGLSFVFDLGVVIQSYDITLTADGPANLIPGFQEDLRREEDDVEDDLNRYKVYPVLAVGLAYRF
jgi:hypothetical protein